MSGFMDTGLSRDTGLGRDRRIFRQVRNQQGFTLVDKEMTAVSASTASTRITDTLDWDAGPGTQTIAAYTREASTKFCYQWATTGRLTAQFMLNSDNSCSSTQTNP